MGYFAGEKTNQIPNGRRQNQEVRSQKEKMQNKANLGPF